MGVEAERFSKPNHEFWSLGSHLLFGTSFGYAASESHNVQSTSSYLIVNDQDPSLWTRDLKAMGMS